MHPMLLSEPATCFTLPKKIKLWLSETWQCRLLDGLNRYCAQLFVPCQAAAARAGATWLTDSEGKMRSRACMDSVYCAAAKKDACTAALRHPIASGSDLGARDQGMQGCTRQPLASSSGLGTKN